MKLIWLFSIVFFLTNTNLLAQNLSGTWKGVVLRNGTTLEKGTLLYADFEINNGILSGKMREESYGSENYAVKKIKGNISDSSISFKQVVISKNKKSSRQKWCRIEGNLKFDSKTGYLTGHYTSYDCRRNIGKIILFRANFELATSDSNSISQIWYDEFVRTYKDGLNAPEIRIIERDNFVFQPVYFDFDKAEIRTEHEAFLNELIRVVKGHTDLRVKVIGNTDANGSDTYNNNLSKRRAEAIIAYFEAHGLNSDRLEFDFKGEKNPVDTNNTPEGRQKNRRVDFTFI